MTLLRKQAVAVAGIKHVAVDGTAQPVGIAVEPQFATVGQRIAADMTARTRAPEADRAFLAHQAPRDHAGAAVRGKASPAPLRRAGCKG